MNIRDKDSLSALADFQQISIFNGIFWIRVTMSNVHATTQPYFRPVIINGRLLRVSCPKTALFKK